MPDSRTPHSLNAQEPSAPVRKRHLSMHEDVELWCDCCSCEAEPRWRDLEEELTTPDRPADTIAPADPTPHRDAVTKQR